MEENLDMNVSRKPKVTNISFLVELPFWTGMPAAENFAFSFNTLLGDIAVHCPEYQSQVFRSQITLVDQLFLALEAKRSQGPIAQNTKSKYCSWL